MLDITKHKNNHIELHLGAYFRGFISTISGFFVLCFSGAVIFILAKDPIADMATKAITLVILIALIGIFVNIFLGIEGVEFDLDKRTFRKYVKRLGIKSGDWKSLESYSMLCLSAQYNKGVRQPLNHTQFNKHRSLEINLASPDKKAILLAECKNYTEAVKALEKLNQFLNLEIKDFVKEQYTKPSPRR